MSEIKCKALKYIKTLLLQNSKSRVQRLFGSGTDDRTYAVVL